MIKSEEEDMTPENLTDLYVEQLQDLYSAESQLETALPKMANKAHLPELKRAFETHLQETREHKRRLEQVFNMLGKKPSGKTCKAMEGIIKEADNFIDETHPFIRSDSPAEVIDAGLIAEAQRAEHYEISGYGTVATYAETLGRKNEHNLLGMTIAEEKKTDELLSRLAEQIVNPAAIHP